MVQSNLFANCEPESLTPNWTQNRIPNDGGPQMEVRWTNISMKQDFEGNIVVTYENEEMILEVTEGTMLIGGLPE